MGAKSDAVKVIVAILIALLLQTVASASIVSLSGSWEMRVGDSPVIGGVPAWTRDDDDSAWRPYTFSGQPGATVRGDHEYMWLKTRLPDIRSDDTVIFVEAVDLIMETYIDGKRVFSFGDFSQPAHKRFNGFGGMFVSLKIEDSGKTVFFRFNSSHMNIGFVFPPKVGPRADFIQSILIRELDRLALSFLMVVMALVAGLLFVFNRRDASYGAFALLAGTAGTYLYTHSTIKFILVEAPLQLYYIETIALYLIPVGYASFIYNTVSRDKFHFVMPFFYAAFAFASFLLPLFDIMMLKSLIVFQVVAVLGMIVSLGICIHVVIKGNREAVFVVAGIGTTFLTNTWDILIAIKAVPVIMPVSQWGFFVFTLCLATILVRRYAAMQRDVVRFSEEIQRQNEELKVVDKLKDQFLANTSHELRTPLVGILGIAESVLDGAVGPISEQLRRNITLIAQSGRRLTSLINDILDFSRMRERAIEMRREAVSLHDVLEVVLTTSHHLVGKNDVSLQNAIVKEFPKVRGDSNRIQQVLYNLIGNAIKFTKHGTVRVNANETDNEIVVQVSDTGAGIPQDRWETIFLPFEQGDASSERESGGTGIGLTVTRQLIEAMGGRIWLDSTVGMGSTFFFSLPKATSDDQEVEVGGFALTQHLVDASTDHETNFTPAVSCCDQLTATILVVDDEPVNRQVLQNHLNQSGFVILESASGIEALEHLKTSSRLPDLILLDVMMPGMSGYTVCTELRKEHSMDDLPIIFLTAKNQVSNLVEGFSVGGNDYLTKPFCKSELLARIDVQLRLKRTNNSLKNALDSLDEVLQLTRNMALKSERQEAIRLAIDTVISKLPEPRPVHVDIQRSEISALGYRQEMLRRFSWPDWFCTQTSQVASDDAKHLAASLDLPSFSIAEAEQIVLTAIADGQVRARIEVPWQQPIDGATVRFMEFVIESLSGILTTFDLREERDRELHKRVEGEKRELIRLVGLAARISDRLNSPLLVLFNTMESLTRHLHSLATIHENATIRDFWLRNHQGLKESLERLNALSDELAKVRDQGEELEATKSMAEAGTYLARAKGEL